MIFHILNIKRRNVQKGLIVVTANMEQIRTLVTITDDIPADLINKSWPGPVTLVLPARSYVPHWLCGNNNGHLK